MPSRQFHQPFVNSWLTRRIEIELIKRLTNFRRSAGRIRRPIMSPSGCPHVRITPHVPLVQIRHGRGVPGQLDHGGTQLS
jgi:hypothetical protein